MLRPIFVTPMLATMGILCGAALLPAQSAFAQDARTDCTVGTPGQPQAPVGSQGSAASQGQAPKTGSLTETLDNCNGVLTPPKVGDGDIVEPAPQTGNMPVITPGDVAPSGNSAQQP